MSFSHRHLFYLVAAPLAGLAQSTPPVEKLSPVVVAETPSVADKHQLPQVTESVTALSITETVNVLDPEDAVKYLPSVFLRKRNNGDTQAVLATRTWGVSSSARSLIFADGVPLTALIANNNSIGGPRWGLVAPAEIERIDLMYGPFAAAYPGNSVGAVMEITTRLPEKFTATLEQTFAWQDHSLYGTHHVFRTAQSTATVGDRAGRFSYWASVNYQDSYSQPLSYVTANAFPTGTTGGYAASNKLGAPANILGASGLMHTRMTNAKVKLAYDLTPTLRAVYTLGAWRNDADSAVETYLQNAPGQPTFAGQSGFASGYSQLVEEHSSHSLSLRSDPKAPLAFEAIATLYRFDRDDQKLPTTASATGATSPSFGTAGRVARLGGTGWRTLDIKGAWRPEGKADAHVVTFGVHDDRYKLYNPTFAVSDWRTGVSTATSVASEGDGKTHTQAAWVQDVWQVSPSVRATLGARYEDWTAIDGLNVNGTTTVRQPAQHRTAISPKLTIAWSSGKNAPSVSLSYGQATRFATPAELYQLVTTGSTFTSPNPDLKPDDVRALELKIEQAFTHGRVRVSLFQDDVHDAIISQFKPLVTGSTQLFSYLSNVDHVRSRGLEVLGEARDVFVRGLDATASVTFLEARTLATSGQGQFGSAIGRPLPNIPGRRATVLLTYRPSERWAFSAAGRYSDRLTTTLDAADVNFNTYQGFAAWFVADVHATCRISPRWTATLGVDNVLNREYFLFHPFPQRTVVSSVKYAF